jgi:predicted RNA-binding Zn-ribbon protein involved in translation (DUF1610 family)
MTTTIFDIHCRACGQAQYEIEIANDAVVITCENCGETEVVKCES